MSRGKKQYEVAYICNGKDPKCIHKTGCFYKITNGIRGSCSHTRDIQYAINKKINPEKNPDRFEKFKCGDNVRYYERFTETID